MKIKKIKSKRILTLKIITKELDLMKMEIRKTIYNNN